MLSASAIAWLERRGLDPEIADRLGVGTVQRGDGDWVAIPFQRNGETVNRKYRRIDQKAHSQDKNAVKCVWNEDALRDVTLSAQPVIITEGEWDALAAIQSGFARTVSVPDGAPAEAIGDADSAKYSYVEALLPLVKDASEIVIAADGDGPGANLLSDLSIRLGKARCKYLVYPKTKRDRGRERCKDLNEVLEEYGAEGVRKTIERAAYVEIEGVFRLSELPPEPPLVVYRAGFSEDFDARVGIVRGHLSVWTGIPNHGKSALVNALAVEMAFKQGWTIAMAMFEGSAAGPFRRDVARYLARKPWMELNRDDVARADAFIEKHFVFVVPKLSDFLTLEWLVEKAEAAVVRHGAQMFVVDPWNQLDHEYGPDNETTYTSKCIKLLQRFSRRYAVHTAIVAHPKKMDFVAKERLRVPNGYDIAGSANWANHPELGVTVYRDTERGHDCALVRVWKSKRHDEMGSPGDVRLRFFGNSGRYEAWFDPIEEAA